MPDPDAPRRAPRSTAEYARFALVQTAVPPALSVLLLPILVNGLGDLQYGLFATLVAAFGLAAIVDLGLSKSVTRFVAVYVAQGRGDMVARFASTAAVAYSVLGVLVLAASLAFGAFGLGLIGVPDDLRSEGFWACVIFGVATAYNLPAGVLGGVMGGLRRHDAESGLNVAVAVVSAAGMAAAALGGGGVVATIAAFYLPQVVKPWVRLPLIRSDLPDFRLSPRLFERGLLKEISGYSVWSFLVDAGNRLQDSLDVIVVAAAVGLAVVTPYNVGLQMGRILQRLTVPVAYVLLPVAAGEAAPHDSDRLRQLATRATRLALAAAIALAGPLIFLADDVIRVWVGSELPLATDIGRVFLAVSIVLVARAPLLSMMEATHRGVRIAGALMVAETLLNLALSIGLVLAFGARGVVVATAIAVVLVTSIGVLPAAIRVLGLVSSQLARRVLMPRVIPTIVGVPLWLGLSLLVADRGAGVVVGALCLGVLAFSALAWTALPRDDREALAAPLRRS